MTIEIATFETVAKEMGYDMESFCLFVKTRSYLQIIALVMETEVTSSSEFGQISYGSHTVQIVSDYTWVRQCNISTAGWL